MDVYNLHGWPRPKPRLEQGVHPGRCLEAGSDDYARKANKLGRPHPRLPRGSRHRMSERRGDPETVADMPAGRLRSELCGRDGRHEFA